MTTMIDLGPAAREITRLLDGVENDQLDALTPCPDYTVAALLDHFMGLTLAFMAAARKEPDAAPDGPTVSADRLDRDWRVELPKRLDALAAAWREPDAWTGNAAAGGVEMPAADMGAVALDEIVLHGWDLARATGQNFEADPASTEVIFKFTSAMSEPGQEDARDGLFGPVVPVADDAPMLERALGFSGRDPAWPGGR